jgi:hypothetical protein
MRLNSKRRIEMNFIEAVKATTLGYHCRRPWKSAKRRKHIYMDGNKLMFSYDHRHGSHEARGEQISHQMEFIPYIVDLLADDWEIVGSNFIGDDDDWY